MDVFRALTDMAGMDRKPFSSISIPKFNCIHHEFNSVVSIYFYYT